MVIYFRHHRTIASSAYGHPFSSLSELRGAVLKSIARPGEKSNLPELTGDGTICAAEEGCAFAAAKATAVAARHRQTGLPHEPSAAGRVGRGDAGAAIAQRPLWRALAMFRTVRRRGRPFSNPSVFGSYEKNGAPFGTPFFSWQPKKDSNPHKQSQSLSCYLYTIRLYSPMGATARHIISNHARNVNAEFARKQKIRTVFAALSARIFDVFYGGKSQREWL